MRKASRMKLKSLTLCLLLLFSAVAVSAQEQAFKDKIKHFKNSRRFSVRYDKFKDVTWITVGAFATGNKAGGGLSGAIGFAGERPTGEPRYYFIRTSQETPTFK